MCGELARAWGNELFGELDPSEDLYLAAEQHELGMLEWDRNPALDPHSGLPVTVQEMDLSTHLPLRLRGPERVRAQSPYAALLVSLHHTSFYAKPPRLGLLRKRGRQINSYLASSAEFQRQLREAVGAPDPQVERNWRLVRAWDGLSHCLMYDRAPGALEAVPTADGRLARLEFGARDGVYTLDPWPFEPERVRASAEARLLEGPFSDRASLREGLAAAPRFELSYELVPR